MNSDFTEINVCTSDLFRKDNKYVFKAKHLFGVGECLSYKYVICAFITKSDEFFDLYIRVLKMSDAQKGLIIFLILHSMYT